MSTIDDKLKQANDNVPKVYNAGGEGKSTATNLMNGDDDYSLRLANAEASGIGAVALGCGTSAEADHAFTSGCSTVADGEASHAEGDQTVASGKASHSEGYKTLAGQYSHAEGSGNSAGFKGYKITNAVAGATDGTGTYTVECNETLNSSLVNESIIAVCFMEGVYTYFRCEYFESGGPKVMTINEVNPSNKTITVNNNFILPDDGDTYLIFPYNNTLGESITIDSTDLISSHAEGITNSAFGSGSHAEGYQNAAYGNFSHVEGHGNYVSGDYAHVEGEYNNATGNGSHAEGNSNISSGNTSHVEGACNVSSGEGSHAEGYMTKSIGYFSHTEGNSTTANGTYSHAEGDSTIANGSASHAEGTGTKALGNNQHVQGIYNIEDDEGIYAHIIGNGSPETKSNAHTLDWMGNAWFSGDVESESYGKLSEKENTANKVTEISDTSTDEQYPSAKAVNDTAKAAKAEANSTFANALKGSASGENAVRIDDSSPIEHEMSVKVSSKNLMPYPYNDFTKTTVTNGITFTNNGDGTITANGTATGIAQIFLNSNKKLPIDCNLSYAFSGCPENGGNNLYYCDALCYNDSTLAKSVRDVGDGNIISPSNSVVYNALSYKICIETGTTVENLVFRPQLEYGTTATEYTPYVSDLTSVTVTQRGKNLLPYIYIDGNITRNGITYTRNTDGTVTISGTSTGSQYFIISRELKLPKRIKVTHQAFSDGSDSTYNAIFSNYNGTTYVPWLRQTTTPLTISISSNRISNLYKFEVLTGTTLSNKKAYPIVELGDTYTGYEPVLPEVNYTPSADGTVTGVKNIYPTTTLLSDTDGVVIGVEYNRDINKAFEELQNAILSQGGNV